MHFRMRPAISTPIFGLARGVAKKRPWCERVRVSNPLRTFAITDAGIGPAGRHGSFPSAHRTQVATSSPSGRRPTGAPPRTDGALDSGALSGCMSTATQPVSSRRK